MADFRAFGGQKAINADRMGITQKRGISEQLSKVIRTELQDPEGYHAQALGLMGALNQI
jgi:hypothetical protein